jgi:type IV secretion system pilin
MKLIVWAHATVLAADPSMAPILSIINSIKNALIAVLSALAIAALTYAGIRYALAGRDPAEVEKAKGAVKAALIGLGLALLAPVLVEIVKQITG